MSEKSKFDELVSVANLSRFANIAIKPTLAAISFVLVTAFALFVIAGEIFPPISGFESGNWVRLPFSDLWNAATFFWGQWDEQATPVAKKLVYFQQHVDALGIGRQVNDRVTAIFWPVVASPFVAAYLLIQHRPRIGYAATFLIYMGLYVLPLSVASMGYLQNSQWNLLRGPVMATDLYLGCHGTVRCGEMR